VEQILNKEQKDFFSDILANPGQVSAAHASQLKTLVATYPQSGILHALLARASQIYDQGGFQQKLKTAAVYAPDRVVLYNLINYPERLIKTREGHATVSDAVNAGYEDEPVTEAVNENNVIENTDPAEDEPHAPVNYFHEAEEVHQPDENTEPVQPPASEIDDEVFDEITGIEDIHFKPADQPVNVEETLPEAKPADEPNDEQEATPVATGNDNLEELLLAQYGWVDDAGKTEPETIHNEPALEEEHLVEPVKTNDYSFASRFKDRMSSSAGEEQEYEHEEEDEPTITEPTVAANEAIKTPGYAEGDDHRLSKYNDDKLPYSFMWWLDKTRKEHAGTHQPYTAFEPITQEVARVETSDELQQQYYENIFHSATIDDLDKGITQPVIDTKRKEDEIIERFIQEDPQIKPPSNEKLDNENKAKKSAEDEDELVSETLARVYTDQMLYHKAVLTYKKLILKFPEKSSYFVAQIKLLEKKTN
jgi:hypothetical protein